MPQQAKPLTWEEAVTATPGSASSPPPASDPPAPAPGPEPEPEPDEERKTGAWRAAMDLISSGIKTGTHLAQAGLLADPAAFVADLQGVFQTHLSQAGKATSSAMEAVDRAKNKDTRGAIGATSEAVGHGIAAALPGIGPAAAQIGESFAEGDNGGALVNLAALLAPSFMKGALKFSSKPVVDVLNNMSKNRIKSVMTPEGGAHASEFAAKAAKVAEQVARDPALKAWSDQGLKEKISTAKGLSNVKLDKIYEDVPKDRLYSLAPMKKAVQAAIDELTLEGRRFRPEREASPGQSTVEVSAVPSSSAQVMPGQDALVSGAPALPPGPLRLQAPPGGSMVPVEETPAGGMQKGRKPGAEPTIRMSKTEVEPHNRQSRLEALKIAQGELDGLGDATDAIHLRELAKSWGLGARKAAYMDAKTPGYMEAKGSGLGWADAERPLRDYIERKIPGVKEANAESSYYTKADEVMRAMQEAKDARINSSSKPYVSTGVRRLVTAAGVGAGTHAMGAGPTVAFGAALMAPILDAAASSGFTTKIAIGRGLAVLSDAIRGGSPAKIQAAALDVAKSAGVKLTPQVLKTLGELGVQSSSVSLSTRRKEVN